MAWSSGLQMRIIDGQRERRDRVIRLDGKELKLGRAVQGQKPGPGELWFKEPTVSRAHATLTWKPLKGGFQLVHRSKTNPTLVNGKPTKKILLAPGDRVQMGLLILEVEDAPGGRSSGRSSRSSMTEPIMEALSKVEREHEEDQRRTRAEREQKQRQREILASPDRMQEPGPSAQSRKSTRLDEALRSAPYSPKEEPKKRRSIGFGWQPPEEREPDPPPRRTPPPRQEPPPPQKIEINAGDSGGWLGPKPGEEEERQPQRRTIPITSHEEKQKPPVTIENEVEKSDAVYELAVIKGPDRGKSFALKDMVMVLGQKQGDSDERGDQGVLLNDATLPGEIGMFVWQGREGAYGLLASENSMQIIEVERLDNGQLRRLRVDSHSSILLRVADEIQVGLTTLRVQKIGEPLPDRAPPPSQPPAQAAPQSRPPEPPPPSRPPETAPGRPTSLRSKQSSGFGAPPAPARPQGPARERKSREAPPPPKEEAPVWAAGTLMSGSASSSGPSAEESMQKLSATLSSAPKGKESDSESLHWGSRPDVDFLLEFVAGPLRGGQISLNRSDLERVNRLFAGSQGGRNNDISLEGPDITNEAFHLIMEGGRFSLCSESISGLLVVNRSPLKTGDSVVLMTGDVITLGSTKIRFLEREVVDSLCRFGLEAESGVSADQDRIFPINRQRLLIGRGKACDVRLSDLEVSRVHLGLAFSEGQFSVQHRSETNPTFLNGLSLLPGTVRKIKEGDRIRLSSLTVLRLVSR